MDDGREGAPGGERDRELVREVRRRLADPPFEPSFKHFQPF